MQNIKEFIETFKPYLIMVVICAVCLFGYEEYKNHQAVPVQTIQKVDYTEVAKAMQLMGINKTPAETKYITDKIVETKQLPPEIVYVTQTQQEAVTKAQDLAKTEKADFVLQEKTTPITNSFYSVHAEKTHKIKTGASFIDSQAYIDVGYQQGKNEAIVHYSPATQKYGATYMRTIAEW